MASRTSPSGARSAPRADAGRVERYAALLDLQLHGGSDSATGALEEALGRRRLVEAGQAIGEFASAVCVTGLVVVDTGTYWSPFGQAVILLLFQLGQAPRLRDHALRPVEGLAAGRRLLYAAEGCARQGRSARPRAIIA